MNKHAKRFAHYYNQSWRSRFFLLFKLPSAFFSGVRVCSVDYDLAVVSVPYKWFSQNPFKSTYFACLAMAAELSTGLLAMMQCYKRKPTVSMLVVKMEAHYFKKATGITFFTCDAGKDFERVVDECVREHTALTYVATAVGRNEQHEKVAEFFITWSFKPK
jgi:hypothetical protein